MFTGNILFVLMIIYGFYSKSESAAIVDHLTKTNGAKWNCNQFTDDFDVIRQFPFRIQYINNTNDLLSSKSRAMMNEEKTFVTDIAINNEKVVPWSLFCLSNIEQLIIDATPFENGVIPDALANLQKLRDILIFDSPIIKITEQMGRMTSLDTIEMINCSLTSFPDLSNITRLIFLDLSHNHLSNIIIPSNVSLLDLTDNNFDEIPKHPIPEKLLVLQLDSNYLKENPSIGSYKNLTMLSLRSINLTSIPSNINELEKLEVLDFSDNKLTNLPDAVFKLPKLEHLNVTLNLFPASEVKTIKNAFRKSHPKMELVI